METGILSLVATPIGNLEDMTYRAVRTLTEADYILCEDTRVTGKLLQRYEIATRMKRYDAHASDRTHDSVVADVLDGKRMALVSDAGTPGVSDPGVLLVQQVRAAGGLIEVIPGPSAVTAAVSLAGFTGNQFVFLGFAPQKKGRETFFTTLATQAIPVVFFESTHRIKKALQQLVLSVPTKPIYVARELTKLHEDCLVGTPSEILNILETNPVKQKGEFVIIVDPR
jgi:16S rRNA (cytidine1402-2'-O)-methyltransferase